MLNPVSDSFHFDLRDCRRHVGAKHARAILIRVLVHREVVCSLEFGNKASDVVYANASVFLAFFLYIVLAYVHNASVPVDGQLVGRTASIALGAFKPYYHFL
jgi:hypothetical protein